MQDTIERIGQQSDISSITRATNVEEAKAEEPSAARVRIKRGARPSSAPHPSRHTFVSSYSQAAFILLIQFSFHQHFPSEPPSLLNVRSLAAERELIDGANTFLPGPSGMIKLKLSADSLISLSSTQMTP